MSESGTNLRGKGPGREAELRNGALALAPRHLPKWVTPQIEWEISFLWFFAPFFFEKGFVPLIEPDNTTVGDWQCLFSDPPVIGVFTSLRTCHCPNHTDLRSFHYYNETMDPLVDSVAIVRSDGERKNIFSITDSRVKTRANLFLWKHEITRTTPWDTY
jgi:hypothetical protein